MCATSSTGWAGQLAYTTVMTTLDRLYKKGLLARRKSERAFIYSRRPHAAKNGSTSAPAISWQASSLRELLISCLVEAVGQHDKALLDDLEKKIKLKRKELDRKEKP